MEHLISVIVPVYNPGGYLAPCLESLIAQTYRNLEMILVDDGSTDGSGAVCDAFARLDGRIKVIHQQNSGVSAARNAGLEIASGDYLTFVDSDDALIPRAMETALEYLLEHGADVVTYGWLKQYEDHAEDCRMEFEVTEDISGVIRQILMQYSAYGGGYPWNKLWRRETVLYDCRAPEFAPELYYFEDLEWVVRMLLYARKLVVCPEVLYRYRVHSGSVSNDPAKHERRELGYHRSVERIIRDLAPLTELQSWFEMKYAPEIVNGVRFAVKNRYPELRSYLSDRLNEVKGVLLRSDAVSANIKFRCRCLQLLQLLHLL